MIYDKKIFKVVGHVFWRIQMAWTILQQDHQKNISAKLYWNRSSGFGQEDF